MILVTVTFLRRSQTSGSISELNECFKQNIDSEKFIRNLQEIVIKLYSINSFIQHYDNEEDLKGTLTNDYGMDSGALHICGQTNCARFRVRKFYITKCLKFYCSHVGYICTLPLSAHFLFKNTFYGLMVADWRIYKINEHIIIYVYVWS